MREEIDNVALLEAPCKRTKLRVDTQAYRAGGGEVEELPYVPSLPLWAWHGNGTEGAKRQRFIGCPSYRNGSKPDRKAREERKTEEAIEDLLEDIL